MFCGRIINVAVFYAAASSCYAEATGDASVYNRLEYQSNLFNVAQTAENADRLKINHFDDVINTAGARAKINWLYSNQFVTLDADFTRNDYYRYRNFNNYGRAISARIGGQYASLWQYGFAIRHDLQSRNENTQGILDQIRNESTQNTVNSNLSYRLDSNLTLSSGIVLSNSRWAQPAYRFADADSQNGELGLTYQRSDAGRAKTFVALSRYDFPHRGGTPLSGGQWAASGGVELETELTGRFGLLTRVAFKALNNFGSIKSPQTATVYNLDYHWKAGNKDTLSMLFKHDLLNNTLVLANYATLDEFGLRNAWQARHNVTFDAGLALRRYGYYTERSSDRVDRAFRVSANVDYLLHRNVSASFDAAREWHTSDASSANYASNTIRMMLKLLM